MILGYGGNVIMYGGHAFTPVDKAPVPVGYSVAFVNASDVPLYAYTYYTNSETAMSASASAGGSSNIIVPYSGTLRVSGERYSARHMVFATTGIDTTGTGWVYTTAGSFVSGKCSASGAKVSAGTAENRFTATYSASGTGRSSSAQNIGHFFTCYITPSGNEYPSSLFSVTGTSSSLRPAGISGNIFTRAYISANGHASKQGWMTASAAILKNGGGSANIFIGQDPGGGVTAGQAYQSVETSSSKTTSNDYVTPRFYVGVHARLGSGTVEYTAKMSAMTTGRYI